MVSICQSWAHSQWMLVRTDKHLAASSHSILIFLQVHATPSKTPDSHGPSVPAPPMAEPIAPSVSVRSVVDPVVDPAVDPVVDSAVDPVVDPVVETPPAPAAEGPETQPAKAEEVGSQNDDEGGMLKDSICRPSSHV